MMMLKLLLLWHNLFKQNETKKMTAIKTFSCQIRNEYGGVFPGAFVAVRAWSENSQSTGVSEDCEGEYTIETELDAITYKVNYWYTNATKQEDWRSCPLIKKGEDGFTDVFEVDLDDAEIIQIMNSSMAPLDKVLQVIKADCVRRNA